MIAGLGAPRAGPTPAGPAPAGPTPAGTGRAGTGRAGTGRALAAAVAAILLLAGCAEQAPTALSPPAPREESIDLAKASFTIEPFTGIPGNAADDLTQRIVRVAEREGLTVLRGIGARGAYRLRGFLTAVGNPSATTVTYIFEIEDAGGQPLHRFSGQEPSDGTSADPWQAIDSDTLDIVAERVVASVKAWFTRES